MTKKANLIDETQEIQHYLQWSDKGKTGLFRYIFGAVLVLLTSLLIGQMFSVAGKLLIESESAAATIVKTTFFGFIVSFLLLPLIPRIVNKRPWWSIAMPFKSFQKKNLLAGVITGLCVTLTVTAISYFMNPDSFSYKGFDTASWIPMLFIAAIAFFVQASVEEMTYRGYLTQFVYKFNKSPVIFLFIPAFIFSIPHLGNIEGSNGFMGLLPYILLGLSFGWVAYRSGSLWMSAGLHATSNWFITMFAGSAAEKIEKVSLFIVKSNGDTSNTRLIMGALLQLVLVVIISEVLIRRLGLGRSNVLAKVSEKGGNYE